MENILKSVPSHNDEAEIATLGAVLLDNEAANQVFSHLRADDFYNRGNKIIYSAIIDLINSGQPVDLITISDYLRSQNSLDKCGGLAYISSLTSRVPTSANVLHYSNIVKAASIRRSLARIASTIVASAYDESRDVRELIEEAEKNIFEIAENQQSKDYRRISEVVSDSIAVLENMAKSKDSFVGVPSGFSDLDSMTNGFHKSEFIVIGARPSVGKTAFALSSAVNISLRHKIPVGFFTLEMADMALMQRMLSSEARVDSRHIRSGFLSSANLSAIMNVGSSIYEAPFFIDDTPNIKLLDLRAKARRMRSQQGIQILFIDYIGLIESENRFNVPRHEQVSEISRSLKALARELEIPVVALSQLGRQAELKQPSLADLRESGAIEQDADLVIFLHKDRRDNDGDSEEVELIIAKQRNGPVGSIKLTFIKRFTKFEQTARQPL